MEQAPSSSGPGCEALALETQVRILAGLFVKKRTNWEKFIRM